MVSRHSRGYFRPLKVQKMVNCASISVLFWAFFGSGADIPLFFVYNDPISKNLLFALSSMGIRYPVSGCPLFHHHPPITFPLECLILRPVIPRPRHRRRLYVKRPRHSRKGHVTGGGRAGLGCSLLTLEVTGREARLDRVPV